MQNQHKTTADNILSENETAPFRHNISNNDEINILEYIYSIVRSKWLIITLAITGFVIGYTGAKLKGPTRFAQVLIAPKEVDNNKQPNLSVLGSFNSFMAGQLNLGGNTSLDKIELILSTRNFHIEFVKANPQILPYIYKKLYKETYDKFYDSTTSTWKNASACPSYESVGGRLAGKLKRTISNKNGTMVLTFTDKDTTLAKLTLSTYLTFLDGYLRNMVQENAKSNVGYLENQLINITDPLIREKLQNLISSEMEKAMIVSKEAFQIIDPVYVSSKFKEKKLYPVLLAVVMFFISMAYVVIKHAFSSMEKTAEDHYYIDQIKKELMRII